MAALELHDVTAGYPTPTGWLPVLDLLSLALDRGEWAAVVGPSGCGKTTLLRVGAGLLVPSSGTVRVEGGPPRGRVALLPQGEALLPWRTLLGNVLSAREVDQRPTARDRAEAAALLDRFGLAPFADAYPHEVSGGMRQRAALARTFFAPRPVYLLDEPLGALDPLTRIELQEWLAGLRRTLETTAILVTHDVEEALVLGDRVLVLSGRPARAVAEFPVEVPRDRGSPEFVALRGEVLSALRRGRDRGRA
ncbi:MAG: ABC transporter ATP-binding protein [Candidatus Bipolaricaulota bacterium]|nr:ABC transporter ATP-binding protein [Candidatus Bipolaricaulota bacterium]